MCERHYRRWKASGSTSNPRLDNLRRYVVDADGCWLWQGPCYSNGYGKMSREVHGTRLAHRASYIEHIGPIPDGRDLDHLCRKRSCMNPACLEPVSRAMNIGRGYEAVRAGRCKRGHDLTTADAWHVEASGARTCRECWRIRYRAAGARYRAKRAADK